MYTTLYIHTHGALKTLKLSCGEVAVYIAGLLLITVGITSSLPREQ